MDKKLTDLTVAEFLNLLQSNAPAPGGGSASALVGAVGMGLGMMTANLTLGKKKYADREELMLSAIEAGAPFLAGMTASIDRDTEAFNEVMAAFALPKATEEEKAARKEAIELATMAATGVPYELMQSCAEAMELLGGLEGQINPNCASDLGVAALCIKTAVQGAWLNVLINLGGISNESFRDEHIERGETLVQAVCHKADEVYRKVLATIA
ncbi:MAG: cyclodeaminase/cyclohydrolase family protein [Clostridia bacterium]|nr:cyclodeaminase/cyclohydrolase family protein [Clostridia bacterium]